MLGTRIRTVRTKLAFDHYYGTLRGVRGFSDRNALDGVFDQSGVLPFSVREARGSKDVQYIGDLDHSWDGGHRALRGGWHDNWVPAKTAATMAHYDRLDLPFHYELADTFTLCDAYFCSVPTSTSPNRNYWVSGYTGFEASGARAVGNSAYAEDTHPGYPWTTYPERLTRAGVSWKVFQEWDNYQDNNLEFFTRFKDIARKALRGSYQSLDSFYAAVFRSTNPPEMLARLEEGVALLSPPERALYDAALRRVRPGSLGAEFRAAVESGRLPAVSYLVPSSVDSEHPGASSPAASASITYQVLDALASVPDVWDSTALFITYDENDGYFDHVPPPRPPLTERDEYVGDRPLGLGPRVPMTVVSPWTVGGYVCSEVFDHTSNTRFLERWLGVAEPNISTWRRRVAGDLTGAFDFTRRGTRPVVAAPGPVPPATPRWRPTPPADQRMPVQEPGTRPARPLPYQPDVSGRVVDGAVRLSLRNTGKSSVNLALYPYRGEFGYPVHFDVAGSTEFTVPFTGEYSFTVLGPNGFRREFAGVAGESVGVESSVNGHSRVLTVTLANAGDREAVFEVRGDGRDFRVAVRPGKHRTVPWLTAFRHGWYDLTIRTATFHRRLSGHVENGRESLSG
ncbi:phosphocholine-specific phospholipase C [Saccharothrix sp. NPDC042600]|uniref:phosphocholine-specific phospholipase C n=1 Tax=Saccharothrix TaxID=2071 RepID=UPI0033D1A2D1|nr:phospholipase C, phosphocholine-specific [Saccharothrix mutabilis subsp. capreolus]